MSKWRTLISLFLVFEVLYFGVTRIPRGWRTVLLEFPVITHAHELKVDWPTRLLCAFLLILFWSAVYFGLRRKNYTSEKVNLISLVFSLLGIGTLLVMLLNFVGFYLGPWTSKIAILLPLLGFIFFAPQWNAKVHQAIKLGLITKMALGILLIRIGSQFWYSIFLKPTAAWDEISFWWPCIEFMNNHGFTEYMQSYSWRNYDPAYPMIVPSILSIASWPSVIDPASNFAGLFFGLATIVALLEEMVRSPKKDAFILLALFVYATMVFSQGGWIPVLQWRPGNGDGVAALLIFLVYLLIYKSQKAQTQMKLFIWQAFGLGILAQLIKPPLTIFFIPAIFSFLVFQILSKRYKINRIHLATLSSLLFSALLAKILWAKTLVKAGMATNYQFSLTQIMDPSYGLQAQRVVSLFFTDYRVQFIIFAIFALLCLIRKKQWRLLPFFLFSSGLIASIVWLYMTIWQTTEHESAGRYFTHGLLAWVWIYLVTQKRFLIANLKLLSRVFKSLLLKFSR